MRRLFLMPFIGLMICCCSTAALAENSKLPAGYIKCPKISQLKKNPSKMAWTAPGGWKSSNASFANKLTKFLGAQWQGVNVGNIICLYQSNNAMTFPVLVRFNHLVYAPKGGKWGKNLGDYANCKSNHPSDCLFKPKPTKTKTANIYQELSKIKSSN